MNKNTKNLLVASAVVGLFAGNALMSTNAIADHHDKPPCTKANACDGKGDCATKDHKCGKESKKGKGWNKVDAHDKAECEKKGGHWEEPHKH